MQQLTMTLTGTRPLLQHNVRLVDPLEPVTQELAKLTSKRNKTIADHQKVGDVEWEGGLYFDDDLGPYVKPECIEECLREAAALQRLGKKIERGVIVSPEGADVLPILYRGPRDLESLRADGRFRLRLPVGIGKNKVVRTRPRFVDWQLECNVFVDPSQLSEDQFTDVATTAGRFIGLGDYRPRYGRFDVEIA